MSASSKPTPIAIPNDLADLINTASDLTGLSKQDIMRLAIRIGLEDLKRCNYDLASAVVDAAKGPAHKNILAGAVFTDAPVPYGKGRKGKA